MRGIQIFSQFPLTLLACHQFVKKQEEITSHCKASGSLALLVTGELVRAIVAL